MTRPLLYMAHPIAAIATDVGQPMEGARKPHDVGSAGVDAILHLSPHPARDPAADEHDPVAALDYRAVASDVYDLTGAGPEPGVSIGTMTPAADLERLGVLERDGRL